MLPIDIREITERSAIPSSFKQRYFIQMQCLLGTSLEGDEDGELQGPGRSLTKRAYFDQEFLLFTPAPAQTRYAIVWDYDFSTGIVTFSLACPKNFNQYRPWQNPECHFYIEFPHAATEIHAAPKFIQPSDEDLELSPKRKVESIDDDDLGK